MLKLKNLKISAIFLMIFCYLSCSNDKSPETKDQEKVSEESKAYETAMLENNLDNVSNIRLCTEMLPPPPPNLKIKYDSDTSIYYRDEISNDTIVTNKFKTNRAYIAGLKYYYWQPNQRELKVKFLDGDETTQERVKETAKKWEQFCGIKFNFGNFQNPDISISFIYNGSWSYIGSYSKKMSPSMNFGWLDSNSTQEEYDRVVLHEFGHALGFVHEHQNPKGNIQWNKERVYQYYMRPPNNWDKPTVDENIFYKYSLNEVNATSFDPNSIMLYAIPSELTLNGFSTKENNNLSDLDKRLVSSIYPK